MKLILIGLTFFAFLNSFSQKKQDVKPMTCQIATIQRDSVLVKLKEYPTQVKMLEAYQKQLQSEYDFKDLELQTKLSEYQEQEKNYSEEQKQVKIQALQTLDAELKKFSQEAEQKLVNKEQELLLPMNEKINLAIAVVAEKNGYRQVIDSKSCYFVDPLCDATNLVIEEANR